MTKSVYAAILLALATTSAMAQQPQNPPRQVGAAAQTMATVPSDSATVTHWYKQNVYDPRAEWAPCYYDATHVVSAYATYALPFGRGQALAQNANKVVDAIIGGWEVSPIVSFRTGFPLPVYGAADKSGTFSRGSRADCNSIPTVTSDLPIQGAGGIQWFTNNGNFTTPANGTFGNCAPQLALLRRDCAPV